MTDKKHSGTCLRYTTDTAKITSLLKKNDDIKLTKLKLFLDEII
ncbi:hypothetical protein [Desulfobacula sp.]|nr:hypothetical protein [Desulfobacula sp.]